MREMKDSGIEWVGKIPKNWETMKIKHVAFLKGRIGWQGLQATEYQEEGAYLITGTDFSNGTINWGNCVHITEQRYNEDTLLHIREGDLLITKDGTIGKLAIVIDCPEKVTLNSGVMYIRNVGRYRYVNKFLYYVLMSDIFWIWYTTNQRGNSTIKHLYQEQFYNFSFPFPSLPEQRAIAAYLDEKCTEINALSADIQSEIDTLEAYKRSVITEAVTKGLDKNVQMKDSGIEWIGEIPVAWDIHPVYHYFYERKNKNYALQEQNLLSLSYGKIIQKDINTNGGLLPMSFNTYNIVEAGDIIIRPTDLQNDKRSLRTGLVREKGIITSAYIDLAPKNGVNSEYFYYLLHSYDIQKVFYNMGNGVRQGLNYDEFAKLMIISPTQIEQYEIVSYVNEKCTEIEAIITQKQEQLSILAEYKKSLIYEYVTGKKEVH